MALLVFRTQDSAWVRDRLPLERRKGPDAEEVLLQAPDSSIMEGQSRTRHIMAFLWNCVMESPSPLSLIRDDICDSRRVSGILFSAFTFERA